ncbi:MAG: hypothetical protein WC789_10505 [Lentisphaeria bacterium]
MTRDRPRFSSEAELCDAFSDAARTAGWTVYPETAGWDLLLVGTAARVLACHHGGGVLRAQGDFPAPCMVGIQAEQRPNLAVLAQAAELRGSGYGPHVRAVLVPGYPKSDFRDVARALRLHVFYPTQRFRGPEWELDFIAPDLYRTPDRLPELPPIVPDVRAGVPCPVTLGRWKVAAFAICRTLRAQGHVTRADFRAAGINASAWVDRWIVDSGTRDGRLTRYVAKPGALLPDEMYPRLAEQCGAAAGGGST